MKFYLNALGLNNSAGSGIKEIYESIFVNPTVHSKVVSLLSGRTTLSRPVTTALPEISSQGFNSRNNRLLLQAVLQIKTEIDAVIAKYGKDRVAVILGTSTSGILETEDSFLKKPEGPRDSGFNYYLQEIGNPSNFLASFFDLQNLRYTVSTACTSSAKAFIEAKRLLQADLCDAVLVGGVDSLSSLTLDGFDSLDSTSTDQTNPFSVNRSGINIGEGAAIFIMSKEKSPIEFLGYGESSDAYHISSPSPDGIGAEIAIRNALQFAHLKPEDIGYVNLHGTGTIKNDSMESLVTNRIFGEKTSVSSTKPFIGHTLGAAGAQEAALCFIALSSLNEKKFLPPHLWDGVQDPELSKLNFVKPSESFEKNIFMSNSYAFGGNNVSLIFGGSR